MQRLHCIWGHIHLGCRFSRRTSLRPGAKRAHSANASQQLLALIFHYFVLKFWTMRRRQIRRKLSAAARFTCWYCGSIEEKLITWLCSKLAVHAINKFSTQNFRLVEAGEGCGDLFINLQTCIVVVPPPSPAPPRKGRSWRKRSIALRSSHVIVVSVQRTSELGLGWINYVAAQLVVHL